ncbi:uncharacterized protein EKO05_0000701 [Ascochyta rabiei]|uniref:uncharacterized protein n=1 Tax=Didymella rabiei TaxID=5454 RepID=UPI0021FA94EC|nr:uncharacterized protein EKO05_0000701 [Ascochyta rabiei]UPX10025.1 hypothetical protein EKO05_0000701 [Ascochyta rabiei]
MKSFQLLTAMLIGPSVVTAWLCNCRNFNKPEIRVAGQLCNIKSNSFCYNAKENLNACIVDKPFTDEMCAGAYPVLIGGRKKPNYNFVAQCEHWIGSCPPPT